LKRVHPMPVMPARHFSMLGCMLCAVSLLSAQPLRPVPALIASSLTVGAALPERQPGPLVSVQAGVINAAMAYLGVPYVRGGISLQGVDCSGLVYRVFRDMAGLDLPRGVDGLFHSGGSVLTPLRTGDLLFFDTTGDLSPAVATHVGVYAGGERFVHAASEGSTPGVIVSSLESPYYRERFLGARRVIFWRPPVLSLTVTDSYQSIVQASPFAALESLRIYVYNGMTGGGPLDVSVFRDGRRMLLSRVSPGALHPSELSLVPDTGEWTIHINRIFKGRELQRLTFRVEE
jgi:hypothetical protein